MWTVLLLDQVLVLSRTHFGQGFAVVCGEKETGGMFSHMAVIRPRAGS